MLFGVRTPLAVLALVTFAACKRDAPAAPATPPPPFDPATLPALSSPDSVDVVLLALGTADGRQPFSAGKAIGMHGDQRLDSTPRTAPVVLTAAQTRRLLEVIGASKPVGFLGPHWCYRPTLGFRVRKGADEVKIAAELGRFGELFFSSATSGGVRSLRERGPELEALANEIFGADAGVAREEVLPGIPAKEFCNEWDEQY